MLPLPAEPHPRLPLRDTARCEGPRSALLAFHRQAGPHTLVCGPAGHVLAPQELVADATQVTMAGRTSARVPARERDLTSALLARLGLAAFHFPHPQHADRCADDAVLWLRLGLTQHLMGAVLAHLGERTVGDTALLRQPTTKSALAEVAVALLEAESGLRDAAADGPDDTTLRLLHRQLTTSDEALLKLLGANGLTAAGPGATAYVSQVLADLYAPPLPSPEAA
ncbi:hypothetical protein AQI95_34755 [Streptomyces yokosukanensis]|uniref:Uncharacterized protein n=1 Tax=Streptomyces yokosukanensis TaxID=67386 RepID=A0A101NWL5_9ACTN|nr:hypothetical protein [Streptomyces yokosukanensis]KUN00458.1 hypothetical protein AQI95_34755 [Streptomyces yokosukanensis]